MDEYKGEDITYGSSPTSEEKQNVHTFLHNVVVAKDTTKVGNLTEEEVGKPKLPLRTIKELELFCKVIMNQEDFADYFKKKGEIMTATSLSKDAKLITLAVVQKREVADLTGAQPKKQNKSWFKKKKPEDVNLQYG